MNDDWNPNFQFCNTSRRLHGCIGRRSQTDTFVTFTED